MRRIPIRIKVAAALLVPLVALVAVAGLEVLQNQRAADDVNRQAALVKAATGPSGLFNALQDERARAVIGLVGVEGAVDVPVADNAEARRATDRARDAFVAILDHQPASAREVYEPSLQTLDELTQLRADIDANPGPHTIVANLPATLDAFNRYTELVTEFLDANARLSGSIDDSGLRQGAELSQMMSRQSDVLARLLWVSGEMVLAATSGSPSAGASPPTSSARPPPTWPTCWPSSSRTR